ncbi:hypothetical protein GBAR_LOCUS5658 [Geodia barretti]|uniref:Uncharacterized protein n=1 Tax=Geodia barretti TaxID=519541 RepID=A0AA35RDP8_GEOBA|nr:hypothetical protein GBAR_LOCUS5658 [Geodia barretti]
MEKTVYLAVFFCHWSHGLDLDRINAVVGMNCSYYLQHQQHSARMGGSFNSTSIAFGDIPQLDCQPWFLPSQKNDCAPGNRFGEVLQVRPGTNQTLLLPFYCMTTSENLTQHRDVMGGCLFTTSIPQEMRFFPLPCNISELNQFMCADLNREGQLCGRCQDGYAPPVYSYALHCVNCTDYGYQNWLKYVAVAFGPLTAFCVIIIVFHISATSPYLHGYILFCQLFSLPIIYRLFLTSHGYMYYKVQDGP